MMNFFRKTRQNLVGKNQFIKYSKYAIGEIILIVIGILLALYLNNLNHEKSIKSDQIKILMEIKSNLKSSIISFERAIETEKNYMEYNLIILDYLDHKKPYDPSLDEAFGTYFWTISTSAVTGAYDYLKSKGIDLISNDSLRSNISFMFESEFSILKNENAVWANNLQQSISYPYHVKHFRKYYPEESSSEAFEHAKPFNYEMLLADDYFKSINAEIISNRKWNINSLENTVVKIQKLIQAIDTELEKLTN
jgi:hypothetical protein